MPRKITSARAQAYLDAGKVPTLVIGEVDKWLQLQTSDRDTTVIHPSEMAKKEWCDRSTWHRLNGDVPKKQAPVNLRARLIFDTGHSIHDKWQSWFSSMGVLWGRWMCQICKEAVFSWSDEVGGRCPSRIDGGLHLWEYKEVPLWTPPDVNISGHADGIINPSRSEALLLEVKSVGPGTLRKLGLIMDGDSEEDSHTKFSKISHVETSHFLQTQIYLHLFQKSPFDSETGPVRRAVILYENKADQQPREFVVEYDPKWSEPLFERASDIMWSLRKGREVLCPFGGCPQCAAYEEE